MRARPAAGHAQHRRAGGLRRADDRGSRADREYFGALVRQAVEQHAELDAALAPLAERDAARLDPIERAVLLVAAVELRHYPQLPFRVVIDEAVGLARRFGATDGHKFVN